MSNKSIWGWPFPYNVWDDFTLAYTKQGRITELNVQFNVGEQDKLNDGFVSLHAPFDGKLTKTSGGFTLCSKSQGIGLYFSRPIMNAKPTFKKGELIGSIATLHSPTVSMYIQGSRPNKEVFAWHQLRRAWKSVTHRFHLDDDINNANCSINNSITGNQNERKKTITWLIEHPIWNEGKPNRDVHEMFQEMVLNDFMSIVYVNPGTCKIQGGNRTKTNTTFNVWLEPLVWEKNNYGKWEKVLHIDLCCGGDSLEQAFLHLAKRVRFLYGDGTKLKDIPKCEKHKEYLGINDPYLLFDGKLFFGTGFCSKCGFLVS